MTVQSSLADALADRYSDPPHYTGNEVEGNTTLRSMAARGSCRAFTDEQIPVDLIETLGAVALAAPTKSDLQQRDIVILRDEDQRQRIEDLLPNASWVGEAAALLVFCGNNRRQRQIAHWRGHPFANDHLDAFFNAAVDAAIALGAFVTAAESVGLGCCPLSVLRNRAAEVADILQLPAYVFPAAGLAVGWPREPSRTSKRLPLRITMHRDAFSEEGVREVVDAYDRHREAHQPYARQRHVEVFGEAEAYGWSEDKARQYAVPQREDFGAFVRDQGFRLT